MITWTWRVDTETYIVMSAIMVVLTALYELRIYGLGRKVRELQSRIASLERRIGFMP